MPCETFLLSRVGLGIGGWGNFHIFLSALMKYKLHVISAKYMQIDRKLFQIRTVSSKETWS